MVQLLSWLFFLIVRKLTLSWAVTLSSWLKKVMMGLPASGGDPKIAWELCVVSHAYLLNGSAVFCIGSRNFRSSPGPEWFFMYSTSSSGSHDGNIKGKREYIYIYIIYKALCLYGYCELQLDFCLQRLALDAINCCSLITKLRVYSKIWHTPIICRVHWSWIWKHKHLGRWQHQG